VTNARRRLCQWILTALLERGVDPVLVAQRHQWLRTYRSRSLSPEECRELLGPYAQIRFLPYPRR
jgi:hypothetical protein